MVEAKSYNLSYCTKLFKNNIVASEKNVKKSFGIRINQALHDFLQVATPIAQLLLALKRQSQTLSGSSGQDNGGEGVCLRLAPRSSNHKRFEDHAASNQECRVKSKFLFVPCELCEFWQPQYCDSTLHHPLDKLRHHFAFERVFKHFSINGSAIDLCGPK